MARALKKNGLTEQVAESREHRGEAGYDGIATVHRVRTFVRTTDRWRDIQDKAAHKLDARVSGIEVRPYDEGTT